MVWNWIFKRLFTPERVVSLIKNNQIVITDMMKDSIQNILEDEEIAVMLIQYTDGIYNRYLGKSGKLWSTIGGSQTMINRTLEGEIGEQLNPFSNFFEDGELSLAGLVKGILSNAFRGQRGSSQTQGSPSGVIRGTPLMQPI